MSEMSIEELVPGNIYVTEGGTIIEKDDKTKTEKPFGYDRVKFVKRTSKAIIIETPWGTTCELPLDYKLSSTSETLMRMEFPVPWIHEVRTVIPFEEALQKGIAHEIDTSKGVAAVEEVTGVKAKKGGSTANNMFAEEIINHFLGKEQILTEAAKNFKVSYQKIRYILHKINKKGHGGRRFTLTQTKSNKGLKAILEEHK